MHCDTHWLPLKRTCALGVIPIIRDCESFVELINTNRPSLRTLTVSISGVRFELSEAVLRQFPNTLLGSDEKEYFFDEEKNEYFFDRDPELFRYIMSYYQSGRLHFPKNICANSFQNELVFFGILPDFLEDCCFEEYLDRQQEIHERMKEQMRQANEEAIVHKSFRRKLRYVFENPSYNDIAQIVYYTTGFFIIVSVMSNMAETITYTESKGKPQVTTYGDKYNNWFFCVDAACVIIFTLEYAARLYAAESRIVYMRSVMAIIDLVAIIPFYVQIFFIPNKHFSGSLVTLRVFRVFRIFKFSRHSQGLRILGCTLKSCARELGFLLFSLTLVVIIFATVMYYIEKQESNNSFDSIPSAAWYTIVTMTTLGYVILVECTIVFYYYNA